ncbi:MAG: hypothetical protein FWH49_05055 [Clostridiales bacterium]|nr:hypothetical protein [Clostridiales bacterium]
MRKVLKKVFALTMVLLMTLAAAPAVFADVTAVVVDNIDQSTYAQINAKQYSSNNQGQDQLFTGVYLVREGKGNNKVWSIVADETAASGTFLLYAHYSSGGDNAYYVYEVEIDGPGVWEIRHSAGDRYSLNHIKLGAFNEEEPPFDFDEHDYAFAITKEISDDGETYGDSVIVSAGDTVSFRIAITAWSICAEDPTNHCDGLFENALEVYLEDSAYPALNGTYTLLLGAGDRYYLPDAADNGVYRIEDGYILYEMELDENDVDEDGKLINIATIYEDEDSVEVVLDEDEAELLIVLSHIDYLDYTIVKEVSLDGEDFSDSVSAEIGGTVYYRVRITALCTEEGCETVDGEEIEVLWDDDIYPEEGGVMTLVYHDGIYSGVKEYQKEVQLDNVVDKEIINTASIVDEGGNILADKEGNELKDSAKVTIIEAEVPKGGDPDPEDPKPGDPDPEDKTDTGGGDPGGNTGGNTTDNVVTDISDPVVPMADRPAEELTASYESEYEIPDEVTPLGNLPSTGDMGMRGAGLISIGLTGLAGLVAWAAARRKKRLSIH